jgi:hypothetical protein
MKILTMKYAFLLSCLLSLAPSTWAASAAVTFIDICANKEQGPHPYDCQKNYPYENRLVSQRITVTINPDSIHAGRPGAFYIGVRTDEQIRGSFTTNGWVGFQGGLAAPVEILNSMPRGPQQFVVFSDGLLCEKLGPGQTELWAGYGVLTDDGMTFVNNYKDVVNKRLTPEHLTLTYIQHDMTKSERAWNVLKIGCGGLSNNNNN